MRVAIKRCVMFLYLRGALPSFFVTVVFRLFRLRSL